MKPLTFFLLLFAFSFHSCEEKKAPTTNEPTTTPDADLAIVLGEKVGLITAANSTREAILAAYGKDAKVDSVYLSEGMFGEGVVIFPENSRRKVEVYWDNEFDPKRPAFIRILGDSTGSDWKTSDGITIGTPMSEVQKGNGKPFNISGFGWDYGGFVTDWNGGNFNSTLGLRFEPSEESGVSEKVVGEGGFSSDNPDMVAAKPVVSMLSLRFLADEQLPACILEKVKANKEPGKVNVRKMTVKGVDHYWLNDGAAAYDGIEYIYDADCKEVCQTGGFRTPQACMKIYESGKWELVWEEK